MRKPTFLLHMSFSRQATEFWNDNKQYFAEIEKLNPVQVKCVKTMLTIFSKLQREGENEYTRKNVLTRIDELEHKDGYITADELRVWLNE